MTLIFLLTPAALCKDIRTNKTSPTVYAFMRGKFETPCFHLPGADESVPVGVRCNPLVYELKKGPEGSPSPVPYRSLGPGGMLAQCLRVAVAFTPRVILEF